MMFWRFLLALTLVSPIVSGWLAAPQGRRQISLSATQDFEQQVASVASGLLQDDAILSAAAAITKDNCPLIGIKSLGVDYGLSRTGIAVTVGYNPEPVDIFEERNATWLAKDIVQTAASLQVSQIILGLPLHKNGTEAEQTNLTRKFGQELAMQALARLGPRVPILLWDERYTSKEAAARAHAKDPNRPLYGTLDAEAACIILETYYNDNGKGVERIELTEEQRAPGLAAYTEMQQAEELQRQATLEQRDSNMNKRKESIERAKKMEDEMRAAGTLGESNKKKKKKKKTMAKKRESTTWIIP
jgi:putative transcription antitermination factor YqgF